MVEPSSRSSRLAVLGWVALPGTLLLASDQIYEQTFLTWSQGEQMVGFYVLHVFGPLVVLAFLSAAVGHGFLILLGSLIVSRRLQQRPPLRIPWLVTISLLVSICCLYVPYSAWKRLTVVLMGPGPHAPQFLVSAAHDGDRSMIELLLNRGVSVDVLSETSTALNSACAGGQVEIARFLLAKGAEISRAPDCQGMRSLLGK